MDIKYSELKKKEVFNVLTGENYGRVQDVILNSLSGEIEKLIVPGKKSNFLNCESIEIKFCEIEKIGRDAILVKLGSFRKHNLLDRPKPSLCEEEIPSCEDE